jgi:hypothetical protein
MEVYYAEMGMTGSNRKRNGMRVMREIKCAVTLMILSDVST